MPSPIAHITTGTLAAWVSPSTAGRVSRWRWYLVCLVVTMAPDADAVIGILSGNLGAWHNQASHSLVVGLIVAAVVLPFAYRFLGATKVWRLYGCLCLFYGLHLLLDFFTYGRGIKLLWPISQLRFRSPLLLFYGLRWSDGVVSAKHWITLVSEGAYVMLLAVVALLVWRSKRVSESN